MKLIKNLSSLYAATFVATLSFRLFCVADAHSPECETGAACHPSTRRDAQVAREVLDGGFSVIASETGKVTLSIDGVGHSGTATINVQKPSGGATVRRAFLFASTWGYSEKFVPVVSLEGSPVTWQGEASNPTANLVLSSFYADVTALVKTQLDSFVGIYPATIGLRVEEVLLSLETYGEVLAVIWDDPGQTTDNTASILFGALSSNGDTFTINFDDPVDTDNPALKIDMSLGIGFGAGGNQYSTVEVNNQMLSSSAGGFDDSGVVGNGFLLTVGDFADSNTNPTDPTDTQGADDELYNLVPFVSDGDSSVLVKTVNPSDDDIIFFCGIFTNVRGHVNPYCGDGNVDEREECDDGNVVSGDGCSASCTIERKCGNGNIDEGEECDDRNTEDGDGCSSTCKIECRVKLTSFTLVDAALDKDIMPLADYSTADVPRDLNIRANPDYCPRKVVESALVSFDGGRPYCEKYLPYSIFRDISTQDMSNDDADYVPTTIARGSHTVTAIPYPEEDCRGTPGPMLTQTFVVTSPPACGDGEKNLGEECDDGNVVNGDGCSATCTIERRCGDGKIDDGEECDDRNTNDGDGCSSRCKIECNNKISSFTLVDAVRDTDILTLADYKAADVPRDLNIRANPDRCPHKHVESVRVTFDNGNSFCERYMPYSVFQDRSTQDMANDRADYNPKQIAYGTHTVTATPYTSEDCRGTPGPTYSQTFKVWAPRVRARV